MAKRATAVLSALLLLAAACGGDDSDDAATTTTAGGAATTAAEAVDLSGQTVEVAAVWSGSEQQNFEEVLAVFEEETGADVTFTSTGDDVAATIGPRLQAGSPPDIAMLPQPGLLRDFAAQGALQDIEEVAGASVDENYAEIWRELGSVDGTLYGVWFKVANKSTVWYNVPVLDDAGVEPPEDWDGFLDTAGTISDFGVPPVSVGGADGWVLTDWFENVYLRAAGGDMYDQLAAHQIPWTDQSVKDALGVLAELFADPTLLAGGAQGAIQTDFPTSVEAVFVEPARAAMVFEGDFVADVITSSTDAELGTGADFFPFPAVDGSEPAVVGGGDVAVLFTENEAARELMRFLATPEAAEVWAAAGGFLSANQGVDIGVYPDEISGRMAEELVSTELFRFDMSDLQPAAFGGTVGAGMWKLLQDFVAAPANIDGITAQLEAAAAAAFQ
ncbi:MAG: extracellular solute-binding protein [Acidimicrobiia bacterium]|nr:extracellular solute-binding protein [Acidimicrobiia bacterium]